jgi:uncharacterized protein (UPF0332 family)
MKEYDLKKLIDNKDYLNEKINELIDQKMLFKQKIDNDEIQGHILKSEHNLRFIKENIKLGFFDWVITGCYYTSYHAALALILTKGYSSKNHLATLCILIKEFYKKELTKEDIEMLSRFLDYEDILFYVDSKNKREKASYSTEIFFEKKDVEKLKMETILFVNKTKDIIESFV